MTIADEPATHGSGADEHADEEHHPIGTLFLMALFLLMIAGMWIWMYAILWSRS